MIQVSEVYRKDAKLAPLARVLQSYAAGEGWPAKNSQQCCEFWNVGVEVDASHYVDAIVAAMQRLLYRQESGSSKIVSAPLRLLPWPQRTPEGCDA
jgi:hypothetical protein